MEAPKAGAKQHFQNASERFAFRVCQETFLSLWSYANPLNTSGKELCDVLVVCEPDIVVVSVKDYRINLEVSSELAADRWYKKAVEKSVKQIYGAVRFIEKSGTRVLQCDGRQGLPLPTQDSRKIHRVSVSLGSAGHVLLQSKDYGKGFVHVLDEKSFVLLMKHLDTITDFVGYLAEKERLAARIPGLEVDGEENLLAIYLHRGRTFPQDLPFDSIPNGLWDQFSSSDAFQRKLQADDVSYLWDRLLEYFGHHAISGTLESENDLAQDESVFREMAREGRFGRRVLGETLSSFFQRARAGEIRSRMTLSPRGVGYVFLNAQPSDSRISRRTELEMRCLVARGELRCDTVVGVCVNLTAAPDGHCEDVLLLQIPEWTPELAERAAAIKAELGYFARPQAFTKHAEEFPSED